MNYIAEKLQQITGKDAQQHSSIMDMNWSLETNCKQGERDAPHNAVVRLIKQCTPTP